MTDRRMTAKATQVASGRTLLLRWILRGRMTQAEAAKYIGVSRVQLNQYLNTDKKPGLEMAVRIEDATGIAIRSWLVDNVPDGDSEQAELAAGHGTPAGRVN